MNGAGVVWVFALTFLICADITGRTLFDRPLQAVPEIVALSLIACVFLQLAFAVDGARLTRADIFLSQIRQHSAGMAGGLERFFAIAGALVLLAMTAGAWPDFLRAFRTSEFVGVEGIYTLPITPIKFIVVLGAVHAAGSCLLSLSIRREESSRTAGAWLAAGLAVAVTAMVVAIAWNLELSDRAIGGLAIVAVLAFIALGMPIAIALLSVGFAGLGLLKRDFGIATDSLS
ncbi:MAG: TRAP transporter small permease subunit, partial [Proteobacteria bacterium]|nr:TRAP transporter small permease subunit [Pseudomonadota bacterium]